ncbi:MAG: hypothetical protein H0U98_18420 [Alphaproteobacteria bacterium]|nr:hypothetical protein [Alphaproteobacteria bacterium]
MAAFPPLFYSSPLRPGLIDLDPSTLPPDREYKAVPDVGKHLVFSFLTTDASHDVAPVHSDATPVCLFTVDEREMWMNAPVELALTLQRPPARGTVKIVAAEKNEGLYASA